MNLLRLLLMTITGGVLTWGSVFGIALVAGDDIATTVQFRSFVGVTLAFAIGGSSFIKDSRGLLTNHWGWVAAFAIPGAIWAGPMYMFVTESSSLPILAVIWGTLGGGVAYLMSICLRVQQR